MRTVEAGAKTMTSPKKIGPLIPIVAVAVAIAAAVAFDTWFSTPEPAALEPVGPKFGAKRFLPMPPQFVPGHPEMTHDAAYASFELQIAYLRDVLGKDVAAPRPEEREVWADAVCAEYPNLPLATRAELADSPHTLVRFRAAWAQLTPSEKVSIREKARVSSAGRGPEAITARYAAEGLRVQLCRSAVRGWSAFMTSLRLVPMTADSTTIACEKAPAKPVCES